MLRQQAECGAGIAKHQKHQAKPERLTGPGRRIRRRCAGRAGREYHRFSLRSVPLHFLGTDSRREEHVDPDMIVRYPIRARSCVRHLVSAR